MKFSVQWWLVLSVALTRINELFPITQIFDGLDSASEVLFGRRLQSYKMRILASVFSLVACERSITDDEYQNPTVRALQPAEIHTLDRYLFEAKGDYEIFLPIDDDTWGEFNIDQDGYVQKVNFIERGKSFNEVDDLFLIQ